MTKDLKNKINKAVKHTVKKYKKTYIALEKYDTSRKNKAKYMADSENLRSYFPTIQE
jgi:hypothetical protein